MIHFTGLGLAVVVSAAFSKHLLELLLLRVVENSFDLALAILHDGLCLGVAILFGKRGIGAKTLHLLLTVREDRLKLRHLFAA